MAASRVSVLHLRTGGRRKWHGPGQIICARAPSDPRGTDEAVHCQTIDDMEIPDLGFADDPSADHDWQREGLLAARNVVPEQYVLHAVVLPASGTAPDHGCDAQTSQYVLALTGCGGVDHVTAAVSALAPATVVPAGYPLSATLA